MKLPYAHFLYREQPIFQFSNSQNNFSNTITQKFISFGHVPNKRNFFLEKNKGSKVFFFGICGKQRCENICGLKRVDYIYTSDSRSYAERSLNFFKTKKCQTNSFVGPKIYISVVLNTLKEYIIIRGRTLISYENKIINIFEENRNFTSYLYYFQVTFLRKYEIEVPRIQNF